MSFILEYRIAFQSGKGGEFEDHSTRTGCARLLRIGKFLAPETVL